MWKNIQINIQNLGSETANSVYIKLPHNSKYYGFGFWFPKKLVRKGNNSYAISISYTNDFIFKLKKYGNGKWNSKKVIDEKEINAEEFEIAFECMEDCTKEKSKESYLIVTEPEKVEKEVEIMEELKNEN